MFTLTAFLAISFWMIPFLDYIKNEVESIKSKYTTK